MAEHRRLKGLQTKIEQLGHNEHSVILDMITAAGVHCDKNSNGYFCDLAMLDQDLFESVESYVEFSVVNNKELDVHDRCMHDQMQLLQRKPPATEAKAQRKFPPREVYKSETHFSNKGAKLAFFRRASDAPSRKRRDDDHIEEFQEPVYTKSQIERVKA
jgi:hypothetical protein